MGGDMINYSVFTWKNPMMDDAEEKAYAKNQVVKVLSFDEFVRHIASHNGVFSRGTVKGVVSDTCSCLVEQLLAGNKVQFGELGSFGVSLQCEPANSLAEFSAKNIQEVNIVFTPGEDFENLRSKAEFKLVTSRAVQAAALRAVKEGEDTINLADLKKPNTPESPNEPENTSPSDPDNDDTGGGSLE